MLQKKHSEKYEILFYHLNRNGFASLKSINNFMQATAIKHGKTLSTTIDDLTEQNITWVFSRLHIKMKRYPKCFETIFVDTWRSVSKGCFAFREYNIYDESEKLLGAATTSAALIDLNTRKPVDVPEFIQAQFAPELGRAIHDDFEKLEKLENPANTKIFQVRMSDIDLNNHVNNAAYLDWIIESLPEEILMNYIIMEIEINYLAEAFYGESILSRSSIAENSEQKICIHRLDRKEDGKTITVARTVWEILK